LPGAIVYSSCEPCAVCHTVSVAAGVTRIVYAAPKESVPGFGGEDQPSHVHLMTAMQRVLREPVPGHVVHLPTDDAETPFIMYAAQARP
jgi:guanine deaminase